MMRSPEMLGLYSYRQSDTCFPLGQDTLLLSAFVTLRRGDKLCDLGCGAGALPLLLMGREPTLDVTGVELSSDDAALARENLAENSLPGVILTADLRTMRTLRPSGCFDLVLSNPPYFAAGTGASGGLGRMEETATLNDLCAAAGWLVRNGGRFALTYRPERLADLVESLRRNGLEPKRLQLVQHSPHSAPSALLLEAVRQGRPGLELLPTFIP